MTGRRWCGGGQRRVDDLAEGGKDCRLCRFAGPLRPASFDLVLSKMRGKPPARVGGGRQRLGLRASSRFTASVLYSPAQAPRCSPKSEVSSAAICRSSLMIGSVLDCAMSLNGEDERCAHELMIPRISR